MIAKESQRETDRSSGFTCKKDTVLFKEVALRYLQWKENISKYNITSPYHIYLPKTVSSSVLLKDSQLVDQSLFPVRPESVFIIVKSIFKRTVPHEHVKEASHMQEITALSLPI